MAQKPSIPKGTRDFSPEVMIRRNHIFDNIITVFKKFGYLPIETPAMENLTTLLGKYGEEGDRLIYKVLNSGDFVNKISDDELARRDSTKLSLRFSEKGLRYDLTVPFARYVVQHRNDIVFPFKRYQIQPVWRADRPQRGRYREFYQCDVDVIGSDSLLNEVELIQIADEVFSLLKIEVDIKFNNRKILVGIAEAIGEAEKIMDITVAIDKLDKIGLENVKKELLEKGITNTAVEQLLPILLLEGTTKEKITRLRSLLNSSPTGLEGLEETELVFSYLDQLNLQSSFSLDLTLARGLDYYTGAIIEVKSKNVKIGSLCGGGRYDDLTGIFGLPEISGVGISFGADRIYDVMNELSLFPPETAATTQVLFINFGKQEEACCLTLVDELRKAGIRAELYPEAAKMKKQLDYANRKKIPYVVIIGEDEIKKGMVTLKEMYSGHQEMLRREAFFLKMEVLFTDN